MIPPQLVKYALTLLAKAAGDALKSTILRDDRKARANEARIARQVDEQLSDLQARHRAYEKEIRRDAGNDSGAMSDATIRVLNEAADNPAKSLTQMPDSARTDR